MLTILELCSNLWLLNLRLFHRDVELEILHSLRHLAPTLLCFVAGPAHLQHDEDAPLQPLPSSSVEMALRMMKALRSLELNVSTEKGGSALQWRGQQEAEGDEPLRIQQLGIYSELDDELFEGLVSECSKLVVLDVYVEEDLRTFQCVSFPPVLLSAFPRLDSIRSHVDLSCSQSTKRFEKIDGHDAKPSVHHQRDQLSQHPILCALNRPLRRNAPPPLPQPAAITNVPQRHLPLDFLPSSGSLKQLTLHSLAPAPPSSDHFRYTPQLLADLLSSARSPRVSDLAVVSIRDVRVEWGEEELAKVKEAFADRGVLFCWEED